MMFENTRSCREMAMRAGWVVAAQGGRRHNFPEARQITCLP